MPSIRRPKKKWSKPTVTPTMHRKSGWRKYSESYRRINPICEACLHRGKYTDITPGGRKGHTDHVVPIQYGGAEYDMRNHMGLCTRCHKTKTAEENANQGPLVETRAGVDGLIPVERNEIIEKICEYLQ